LIPNTTYINLVRRSLYGTTMLFVLISAAPN